MNTKSTINSLRAENKDLQRKTKDDMQKLIASANSIDTILKDYRLLLTSDYKSDMLDTMKKLHEVSRKVEQHQQRLNIALQAPGGDFKAIFEQMTADDIDEGDEETFDEIIELQGILNRSNIAEAGPSGRRQRGGKRRGTNDEIEMVEAEESHIDPISKCPIKTAVRNKRCRHMYCYTTIIPYIRSITYPRCPIAGCHLPHIREDDLEFVNLDKERTI